MKNDLAELAKRFMRDTGNDICDIVRMSIVSIIAEIEDMGEPTANGCESLQFGSEEIPYTSREIAIAMKEIANDPESYDYHDENGHHYAKICIEISNVHEAVKVLKELKSNGNEDAYIEIYDTWYHGYPGDVVTRIYEIRD